MSHLRESAPSGRAVPTLLGTVAVCAILYFGRTVLTPLALAALISFVLAPLVRRLERKRVPSALAVALVGSLAAVPVVGTGWIVASQTASLIESLPEYRDTFRHKIADVRRLATRAAGILDSIDTPIDSPDESAVGPPASTEPPQPVTIVESTPLPLAGRLMAPILAPIAALAMVMVFVTFILLERDRIRDRLIALLNRNRLSVTNHVIDEVTQRVGRYLRRQLLINAANGTATAIALTLLGVPNALLWGVLGAILRFIPYLGPIVAALFPVTLAFIVSDNWTFPIMVAAFFVLLELVGDFVEPMLQRSSTGVTSFGLLLAAAFWAWIWGIPGLLLSTPLTVCLVVAGQHARPLRWLWIALADQSPLTPSESLYRQLITGDGEPPPPLTLASDAIIADVADTLLLPVLIAARRDLHRGELDEARYRAAVQGIRTLVERTWPARTPPTSQLPPVLCVPALDEADAAASHILAIALSATGIPSSPVTTDALGSPLDSLADRSAALHACVVSLPPFAASRARIRLRQLRLRAPALCRSALLPTTPRTAAALVHLGPTRIVHSIGEAVRAAWSADAAAQPANPEQAPTLQSPAA